MSKTFREINGIDKAGQKELWERPLNPKSSGGNGAKVTGDNKPNKNFSKPSLRSESLNKKESK